LFIKHIDVKWWLPAHRDCRPGLISSGVRAAISVSSSQFVQDQTGCAPFHVKLRLELDSRFPFTLNWAADFFLEDPISPDTPSATLKYQKEKSEMKKKELRERPGCKTRTDQSSGTSPRIDQGQIALPELTAVASYQKKVSWIACGPFWDNLSAGLVDSSIKRPPGFGRQLPTSGLLYDRLVVHSDDI
jgi:hypothetical protein